MRALEVVRESLARLEEQRSTTINAIESIANEAIERGRNLTATEAREVDELQKSLDGMDSELAALDEREAELLGTQERTQRIAGRPELTVLSRQHSDPWADRGLGEARARALEVIERANEVPDSGREALAVAIESNGDDSEPLARWTVATSDPAYMRAFQKLTTDPMTAHVRMTDEEAASFQRVAEVQRAMSLTDDAGGYMVPFTLDSSILLTGDGTNDPMRDIARKVTIATDKWHGVSSAGVTASWDAEAETVSDDSPTLAQPTVTPHRLTAFIPFSIEAGQDARNFGDEMRAVITDSFATAEGTAFWTGPGDGSNQPFGLVTALDANTNVEVAVTTNDEFNIDDVYKLHEALPPRFRRRGTWAAGINVLNLIRRMGEGTTGSQSAFWADLGADTPPLLLGRPIVEASSMEAFDATGTENILAFGDFSRYVIADRVGTTVEVIPHLFDATNDNRPTGQRGFFAYKRTGGDVVTDEAFRLLQS